MPRRLGQAETDLEAKLTFAADYVAERGARLTPIRRTVLQLLRVEQKPIGAYDLVYRYQQHLGRRVAPNTIYRALDFLVRHRLAAHIASRRAFVALSPPAQNRASVFFTCGLCGGLTERNEAQIERAIRDSARNIGFVVAGQAIEIEGTCVRCAEAPVRGRSTRSTP